MTRLCRNVAAAFDATVELRYDRRYPPLSNPAQHLEPCARVPREPIAADAAATAPAPVIGSAAFAFMLNPRPRAHANLAHDAADPGGALGHTPRTAFTTH